MKKVILFGASGNVGQQTLTILKSKKNEFSLIGFSVGTKIHLVEKIIEDFPEVKMIYTSTDILELTVKYPKIKFISQNICELLTQKSEIVINALSGFYGLKVTLEAIKKNLIVLNANKESFVTGGELIKKLLTKSTAKIYPIDSEHCAIWQCLESDNPIDTIYLTASGGPFLHLNIKQTKTVKLEQALNHPNWSMGPKITVDSATMFNKALEILEAYYLFGCDKIVTLVHPQSIIHSMIMFEDGSIKAQLSTPDMHQVINYFLTYPKRTNFINQKNLDFKKLINLQLQEIDQKRFESIKMALSCFNKNNSCAVALNAANEVCVEKFIAGEIRFFEITKIVSKIFWNCEDIKLVSYEEIVDFDNKIRELTIKKIREGKK